MVLSGKTVFITGGARRLGKSLASYLHQRGCSIVVHYNSSETEAKELQSQIGCRLFHADFSKITVQKLKSRLKDEIGSVDILMNNAGTFEERHWEDIDEDSWDHDLDVNLKIPFFLAHYFGPLMKAKGSGKIINMSDIAAEHPYLKHLPYSIAKIGVIAFTRALARSLAPEVQVNAIAPGTILFPENMPEQTQNAILKNIPAGRTATLEEFLRTVDFLLEDVDYITGQTIVLDGGRSLTW
jgi:NAD(P)-dependent dehydrogenase (short-subunit alcohol dehydrogenase family)